MKLPRLALLPLSLAAMSLEARAQASVKSNEIPAVYAAVIDSVRASFAGRAVAVMDKIQPFGVFADTGFGARAYDADSTGVGRQLWRAWVAASKESGPCACPESLPRNWYLHSVEREGDEPVPFILFSGVAFSSDGRRALVGVHLGTSRMGQSRVYLVARDSAGWSARFTPLTWSF